MHQKENDDVLRRLSNVIAVVAFKDEAPESAALRLEARMLLWARRTKCGCFTIHFCLRLQP